MPEIKKAGAVAQGAQGSTEGCRDPDPISVLEEEHALQLELCDILEHIADGLPHTFDSNLAGIAVRILQSAWQQHTRLEEEVLFPMLRKRTESGAHVSAMLRRLEDEHDTDEGLADEISSTLKELIEGAPLTNAESLGYMLRGFFVSQRRHIAWENDVVFPLARRILQPDDLKSFQAAIMMSDRPVCTRQSLTLIRKLSGEAHPCGSCSSSTGPAKTH
jgi:hemerythrin-like domain-containing protein